MGRSIKAVMKIRIASFALWIVALFVVASHANAQSFEGHVTQTISSPQSMGQTMEMLMSFKGNKIKVDMDLGPQGKTSIFMEKGGSSITVVMEAMKSGMQIDIPQDVAKEQDPADQPSIKATGKKETINGYAAEEWLVENNDGQTMSLWLSSDVDKSVIESMLAATNLLDKSNANTEKNDSINQFLVGKKMLPVRMVVSQNGEVVANVNVTKIEKASIPDAAFVIPADITVQKMPDMPGQ